uniref:Uncharacterized protein LOC105629982 n=2 Tax=Rhizophora mucronata TaxID=61149 RepID=A0A2P2IHW9_RHIMU
MKQKIVIRVSGMTNQKSRSKVLKMTAGFPGVQSVALAGNDKTEIEAIGDEVDVVKLTILVRTKLAKPFCWLSHKMSHAELLTVSPVEEKKEEKKDEGESNPPLALSGSSSIPYCVFYDPYPSPCSIL